MVTHPLRMRIQSTATDLLRMMWERDYWREKYLVFRAKQVQHAAELERALAAERKISDGMREAQSK